MQIFNTTLLQQHTQRAARLSAVPCFLAQRMADDLRERLFEVKRDLPQMAEIAPHRFVIDKATKAAKGVVSCEGVTPFDLSHEILPLMPQSLDAVVSCGHLHWANDLPGLLIQCRHALKSDGVFIAGLAGGETLYELRDSIAQVELEMYGGISPRISPFAGLPDMAELMQRAGFALPVVDHDVLNVTYPDVYTMINDLRLHGQTNAVINRNRKILRRDFWSRVDAYYRTHHGDNGRLKMTVELIYLIGWSPDASQQQPAKRGSATHRLEDILNSSL